MESKAGKATRSGDEISRTVSVQDFRECNSMNQVYIVAYCQWRPNFLSSYRLRIFLAVNFCGDRGRCWIKEADRVYAWTIIR